MTILQDTTWISGTSLKTKSCPNNSCMQDIGIDIEYVSSDNWIRDIFMNFVEGASCEGCIGSCIFIYILDCIPLYQKFLSTLNTTIVKTKLIIKITYYSKLWQCNCCQLYILQCLVEFSFIEISLNQEGFKIPVIKFISTTSDLNKATSVF